VLASARLATAAPLSVEWSAPPCAVEAELRGRVRDALRREPESVLERELRVRVKIAENAGKTGYWLQLELQGGSRELETPSCAEAVAAAATIVALAIDPNAVTRASDAPPQEPKQQPMSDGAAKARERLEPYAAAFGGISLAELPGVSPLWGAILGLRWRGFGAQAEGFWMAPSTALLPGELEKGGEIGLAGGGLALCYSPLRGSWRLTGCVAGQAGAWRARGVAVKNPEQHSALWLAAVARIGVGVSLGATLGLFLNGDLVISARRPSFRLQDLGEVYRPSSAGGRGSAGAELRF
jgi:hypothetical protein